MRSALQILSVLSLASTVPAAAETAAGPSGPVAPEVRKLLGDRAVAVIRGADRVEAFRIDSRLDAKPSGDAPRIADRYPILARGPERDPKFAARLGAVLFDPKTYPEWAKGCVIRPGVAFRFWKGKESVDLILCFECSILGVITRDEQGRSVGRTYRDFDPARPKLVGIARDAFPNDPEIQALQ